MRSLVFYYLCDMFNKSCARHVIRDWKMRRLLLFFCLAVTLGMSSCMDTYYVTQRTTFDAAIKSVQTQMADNGFYSTGSNTNTRNEPIVTGVSYSKYTGYGTAMDNNYITQDTYRFADTLGNTMNYSVSYMAKRTNDGVSYVENLELCGCETSNPKDYERLCGNESIVKQINHVPIDQKVKKINVMNTALAVTGITLGLSIIIYLIALGLY